MKVSRRGYEVSVLGTLAAAGMALVASCTAMPGATGVAPTGRIAVLEAVRSGRTVDLVLDVPGVGTAPLRLLLPAGFEREPERTWPVLYLLHGGGGSHVDWTEESDVEDLTAPLDLIVAMPDSGPGATYVDWAYAGPAGRPQYETYITELLPRLLAAEFRADDRAVVAGLSAGGFGAISYAARHPDRYRAAASFSGNLDTRDGDTWGPWLTAVPTLALDRAFPLGDPLSEEVRWRGHNPLDLVANLRGVDVHVSNGNGQLGPLSRPEEVTDFLWLESTTERRSRRFVARADQLGIPVTRNFYGNGTHSFGHWNRELAAILPRLVEALERPRPAPTAFTYRSVEPRFSVWGWTFEVTGRSRLAFTDVAIGGDHVAATGNGTLAVTAPDGRRAVLDLGGTAERYGLGPDEPGPRPTGPAAEADLGPGG